MQTTTYSPGHLAIKILGLAASMMVATILGPVTANASSLKLDNCGTRNRSLVNSIPDLSYAINGQSSTITAAGRDAEAEVNCFDSFAVSSAAPAATPVLLYAADVGTYSNSGFTGDITEKVSDASPNSSKDPIPEPSTFILLCVGLATGIGFRLHNTHLA
jgi:hypothetical protein